MGLIQRDLAGPGIDVIETHTAWAFLGKKMVWKVKKPVNLGFLDFGTPEKRRAACQAEVRLNARLAPHVYQGVVPVTRDATGNHEFEGGGQAVDWAVRMVRLPDAVRGDVLLQENRLTPSDIERLAEHLARFHAAMPTNANIAKFGEPEPILANVRENFKQAHDAVRVHLKESDAAEIERQQIAFVEGHRDLLNERVQTGRIRDGHGDLRLEHVYIEGEGAPTIIDCIEFNDRFRFADVCADVAFLSMDLQRLGRADLAECFLFAYARASGDYDLYRLVDFYEGYRAYVRGKVASLLASDEGADFETRERAREEARRHYLLALLEGRERLLKPAVVAVGGVIGSGKSTIAERISTLMGGPVVDTDRTRKFLLGLATTAPVHEAPWSGAYDRKLTRDVYAEVQKRAASVLESRRPVVLDASFRSRAHREEARELARRHRVPFYFVECRASPEVCKRRLAERARSPSVSDGRVEIFEQFVACWEAVTDLPAGEHIVIDTALPIDETLRRLATELPTWPVGLNG